MLDLAVLGILKEQPLHGYELRKRLGDALGMLWGISYGSLYPALRRLEREGSIEIVEPGEDALGGVATTGSLAGDLAAARARARRAKPTRRIRKAYQLTARGEQRLTELLLADDTSGDEERSFALKLAFCGHLEPAARLELLQRRRAALSARLAQTTSQSGRTEAGRFEPARGDRYLRSLVEHRAQSTQRDLEWIDTLIAAEQGSDQRGASSEPPTVAPAVRASAVPASAEVQGATAP